MKLSLYDVVYSIVSNHEVSGPDIVQTIELLLDDTVCKDRATVMKVGKMVSELVAYEKSPVS